MRMDTEQKNKIVEECKELMSKCKFDQSKTEQFCSTVSDILQDIIDYPDDDREIKCKVTKRLDCIECRINVSGNKIDPMTDGEGAEERRFRNNVNSVMFNPDTSVSAGYTSGWNHLIVKSPSRIANSKLLSDSMVKAMLLGIVAGIICKVMPDSISSIVLDKIATPIMSTLISLLMGLIGPVFFLFIIVAVSSLGSMEEFSKSGRVILRKFVLTGLWVAVLTIVVAQFFFPVFGKNDISFDIGEIESTLLGVLPGNLISPFTECNIPQIILLGIIFGVGLLIIGESGEPVREGLLKIKEWVMGVLVLMIKVLPLIPFFSTMMIVANGKAAIFIQGWKYIAATYICYIVSLLILFIAVSVRCRVSIGKLAGMLKQAALSAFFTAMPPAAMMECYSVSEKDMGIDSSFTDLWLSLGFNLLSPARTVALVLSVFFVADMTGMTVDAAILIIMLITVVQMSLAATGTTAGVTVTLETLKMSTDMVGLFSAFEMFTRNAGAAYDLTFIMLEQLDAARETGNINKGDPAEAQTDDRESA